MNYAQYVKETRESPNLDKEARDILKCDEILMNAILEHAPLQDFLVTVRPISEKLPAMVSALNKIKEIHQSPKSSSEERQKNAFEVAVYEQHLVACVPPQKQKRLQQHEMSSLLARLDEENVAKEEKQKNGIKSQIRQEGIKKHFEPPVRDWDKANWLEANKRPGEEVREEIAALLAEDGNAIDNLEHKHCNTMLKFGLRPSGVKDLTSFPKAPSFRQFAGGKKEEDFRKDLASFRSLLQLATELWC